MTTVRREQEVEFVCPSDCATWHVEGRFDAEGRFEPTVLDDVFCADCDARGEPVDPDVEVT